MTRLVLLLTLPFLLTLTACDTMSNADTETFAEMSVPPGEMMHCARFSSSLDEAEAKIDATSSVNGF